jgi:hypothetical protein
VTAVDKAALLASRGIGLTTVPLGELGEVKVRALSRAEALASQGEHDQAEAEVFLLALAMVEPKLTEDEVRAWQRVAPAGELQPVVLAILKASGMEQDSPKQAVKTFRGRP